MLQSLLGVWQRAVMGAGLTCTQFQLLWLNLFVGGMKPAVSAATNLHKVLVPLFRTQTRVYIQVSWTLGLGLQLVTGSSLSSINVVA